MSRNGPLALAFHLLFVGFILAPIVTVCAVAFTPEGFLSFPVNGPSLRWFRAIARYRFAGREALTALFMSPLMIPHVVLGIAFLRFFTQIGLGGTLAGLGPHFNHWLFLVPAVFRGPRV